MINIIKQNEPKSLTDERLRIQKVLGRDTTKADYDNFRSQEELKISLLEEQGYLCCYCTERITADNMRVEHFLPKGKDKQEKPQFPELALTYENLLAACSGGERSGKKNDTSRHHCDVKKGKTKLNILPNPVDINQNYQNIISYSSKGKIEANKEFKMNLSKEEQNLLFDDINETLNLNIGFLMDNRVRARETVLSTIRKMKQNGTWQKVPKKLVNKYNPETKGRKEAYCGYIYFWLKKRFNL